MKNALRHYQNPEIIAKYHVYKKRKTPELKVIKDQIDKSEMVRKTIKICM